MKVALFWWLQAQTFYKQLHHDAVEAAGIVESDATCKWADVGCGVGLMSHIADGKGYKADSYDLDRGMIVLAKFLNRKRAHLSYEQQDVMQLTQRYDIVTATSLLSVVDDKKAVVNKLRSLLKNRDSKLVLIEPTEKMSVANVWKMVTGIKTFNHYKLLFVWAKAREGKAVDVVLFEDIKNIRHHYLLEEMVRVTVIGFNDAVDISESTTH